MATPKTMPRSNGRSVSRGESTNKKPLIIAGIIFLLFAFGLYYAAMSRVKEAPPLSASTGNLKEISSNSTFKPIEFTQGRKNGLVNSVKPPAAALPEELSEEDIRESELADQLAALLEKQHLDEFKRSKTLQDEMMQQQYKDAQNALNGTMTVPAFANRAHTRELENPDVIVNAAPRFQGGGVSVGGAPNITDIQRQLAGIPEQFGGQQTLSSGGTSAANTAAVAGMSSTDLSGVVAARDFVSGDYRNNFTLQERTRTPTSMFQLMTGTMIPGVMISAANSELPGDLVAQVTQNVYDSVTGRYLLLPQGAKLFGRYDSFAGLGSERLLMVWDRVVMPDGETLTLGSMQGYDDRGMAGAKDQVITHFIKTLANAFLLSVATSSADAIVDATDNSGSIIGDITASFGDTTATALDEYLSSRLKIKPTFIVRAGYRFNILVNKDITFEEPFEFGYTRLEIQ